MTPRKAEFLKRLQTLFKTEAAEHLSGISQALLSYEKTTDDDEKQRCLEMIYRLIHTLKGASSTVGQGNIQQTCQVLEDLFSLMKKERIFVNTYGLDIIHMVMNFLESVAQKNLQEYNPDLITRLRVLEDALKKRDPGFVIGGTGLALVDPQILQKGALEMRQPGCGEPLPESRGSTTDGQKGQSVPGTQDSEKDPRSLLLKKHHDQFAHISTPEVGSSEPPAQVSSPAGLYSPKKPGMANAFGGHLSATIALGSPGEWSKVSTKKLNDILRSSEQLIQINQILDCRVEDLRESHSTYASLVRDFEKLGSALKNLQTFFSRHPSGDKILQELLVSSAECVIKSQGDLKHLGKNLARMREGTEKDSTDIGSMVHFFLEDVKKVRMQPVSQVLEFFPKIVRDLAREQGKMVRIDVSGDAVEVDRKILDELKDPLLHLVRNSIDHGIETPQEREAQGKGPEGSLAIRIREIGSRVEVCIQDDGRGIDPEKIRAAALREGTVEEKVLGSLTDEEILNLIFMSGFSTSPIVTDLSGRGIGLAIVKEKIAALSGSVIFESQPGKGSCFKLSIPLTMATYRGIIVSATGEWFVIPLSGTEKLVCFKTSDIMKIENHDALLFEGKAIPLVKLSDILGLNQRTLFHDRGTMTAIILANSGKYTAFAIDQVIDEQNLLVKKLGKNIIRMRHISGATVLGSGRVVPVLNPYDLMRSAGKGQSQKNFSPLPPAEELTTKRILIVEDSITTRMMFKNLLEAVDYEVQTAVDGQEAFSFLKTASYDLVISDVEMPRLNGFELTRKIREDRKLSELPVILVTGLASKEDKEKGIDVGANAYIIKSSFDEGNLLEVIQRLI